MIFSQLLTATAIFASLAGVVKQNKTTPSSESALSNVNVKGITQDDLSFCWTNIGLLTITATFAFDQNKTLLFEINVSSLNSVREASGSEYFTEFCFDLDITCVRASDTALSIIAFLGIICINISALDKSGNTLKTVLVYNKKC